MALLGPKQTLTVYALVLTWSGFVFWAGFTFGVRAPAVKEEAGQDSAAAGDPMLRYPSTPVRSPAGTGEAAADLPGPGIEVQEIETGPGADTEPEEVPSHTVQIAAVRSEAEGRELLARLRRAGHEGRIIPPAGSGVLYRVWVGEFASEKAAEEMEETLKSAGFSTYVRQVVDFAGR